MPLMKSGSKKAMSKNISKEMNAGKPQKQAIAIAYSVARKANRRKMYAGGETPDHNLPLEHDVRNHNEKLHPHSKYAEGGLVGSRRDGEESEVESYDDLMHDEHEDFLTDADSEDPYNDLPDREPDDGLHEDDLHYAHGGQVEMEPDEHPLMRLMRMRRMSR